MRIISRRWTPNIGATPKIRSRKLASAGCVVEPLTSLHLHSRRLHDLYLNVIKNAAVRLVTLPESYFAGLESALGSDFACNVVRRGDDIVGFVTALRDGETAIGYYIGFDREAAASGIADLFAAAAFDDRRGDSLEMQTAFVGPNSAGTESGARREAGSG
jgi:hypothetical protein